MARSYIIWRGVDSRDVDGLLIQSLPPIVKPAMRYEETEIDGRPGSILEPLGYQSYDIAVTIGLYGEFDIEEVAAYFTGSGSLVLSSEEEREYNAAIMAQVDFERLLRFRTAEVKFRVQPYKHIVNERARVLDSFPARVVNSGTVSALPVIRLEGSGEVAITVNGEAFRYTFDSDGAVVIDSEAQEAYWGKALKNRNMVGAFPELKTGGNTVEVAGDVTRFEIKTNTRYI